MKNILQLILISLLLFTFGCNERKSDQKTGKTEKQPEQKIIAKQPQSTDVKKKEIPKNYDYKYVIARSGLNYMDTPKGKVLGSFPLNTSLKIIEYTKIPDQINDDGKIINGEWIGVENRTNNKKDTVYVFNGFLSHSYVKSDIKLYYASSFLQEKDGKTRTSFLNMSDTYFGNIIYENGERITKSLLTENNLKNDTVRLNKNQRKNLLDILKITESDQVFVYLMEKDSILNFRIKNLPAIACVNIYGSDNYNNVKDDYQFGFDLGNKIKVSDNLVFVGKHNPFQTDKLKPMVWKKIENSDFPVKEKTIVNDNIILETYQMTSSHFRYYIQSYKLNRENYNYIKKHHLVILDTIKNTITSNRSYHSSEGIDLSPVYTSNENMGYYYSYHWTGELFRNKPPIIYGLESHSFGCPSIEFITQSEPSIPILCDNRH